MKILIADDNKQNRYLLETILKSGGHEVISAENGKTALALLQEKPVDLIVSDVLMPVMDGFRLCIKCKSDEKLKQLPLILITSNYTGKKDEEFALKLGADKFLVRPIEPDKFPQIIKEVTDKAKSQGVSVNRGLEENTVEFLRMYNERVVDQLDKKLMELEQDISERKQAEGQIVRLNSVLRVLRNVNQLITREDDRDKLLKGACANLTKTRGYHSVWIALFDDAGRLLFTTESGLDKAFLPLLKRLQHGELPECGRQVLKQPGLVIKDGSSECADCPSATARGEKVAIAARLEYGTKTYGMLVVSLPSDFTPDMEEQSLFQELVDDIAFGLYKIEMEERRNRAEQAQERLRQKLQAKVSELETFSYGIAHDLRSPLVSIEGFSRLLREDIQNQKVENVQEDIRLLESGVRKMQQFLNRTLEYSRAGYQIKLAKNVSFGKIVNEAITEFNGQISSIGATVSLADKFPWVYADKVRIAEVLTNLIQNSIKYRDKTVPLKIEIGHYPSGNEIVFFVRDNGTGIEESETEKVFDLFYRGSTEGEGSGTGLAIVKKIIEAHGGRIWVQEGQTGKGTTMCFTLAQHNGTKKDNTNGKD